MKILSKKKCEEILKRITAILDTDKHMWVGQKTDITDSAIASVFEWFMANMEGKEEYSITYPETGFELVMRRRN